MPDRENALISSWNTRRLEEIKTIVLVYSNLGNEINAWTIRNGWALRNHLYPVKELNSSMIDFSI